MDFHVGGRDARSSRNGRHCAEHPPGRRRARGHARLWDFYLRTLKKRAERWAALLTERDERAQQSLQQVADLLRASNWSAAVHGPEEAANQNTPSHHAIAGAENGAELVRAVLPFTKTINPDKADQTPNAEPERERPGRSENPRRAGTVLTERKETKKYQT